jgi:hypothetical protein
MVPSLGAPFSGAPSPGKVERIEWCRWHDAWNTLYCCNHNYGANWCQVENDYDTGSWGSDGLAGTSGEEVGPWQPGIVFVAEADTKLPPPSPP